MRPVILMIPKDAEHITVSCIVGSELTEYEYGMTDIKKCLLGPEDKKESEAIQRMTNADRIRNMTDEELAELLCLYDACVTCSHDGRTCNTMNCDEIGLTEKWLKKEVE